MPRRVHATVGRAPSIRTPDPRAPVHPTASRVALAVLAGALALPLVAATAPRGEVAGEVWLDADADGVRGGAEPGRGDVPVSLVGPSGVVDATTTDGDGRWSFTGVPDGTWRVAARAPDDLAFTPVPGGLDANGEVVVEVAGDAPVEVPGPLASTTTGADLVLDVRLVDAGADTAQWAVTVANLGNGPVPGPVQVRVVLDEGLATTSAGGGPWSCVPTGSVVTCDVAGDLAAGAVLPTLDLTTDVLGPAGSTLGVVATGSSAQVDGAPRNDEDRAELVAGTSSGADGGIDAGGPDGGLSDTGGAGLPAGLAALAAGLAGLAALRVARRTP